MYSSALKTREVLLKSAQERPKKLTINNKDSFDQNAWETECRLFLICPHLPERSVCLDSQVTHADIIICIKMALSPPWAVCYFLTTGSEYLFASSVFIIGSLFAISIGSPVWNRWLASVARENKGSTAGEPDWWLRSGIGGAQIR